MLVFHALYLNPLNAGDYPTERSGIHLEYVYNVGKLVYLTDIEKDDDRYYINHHVYDMERGEFISLAGVTSHSSTGYVEPETFMKAIA